MFWRLKIEGRHVNWLDLKNIIEDQHDGLFIWRDSGYIIPDDFQYILSKSPSVNFDYKYDARDCDDGNRILRGWLSQKGYGNVLCMDVSVIYPNKLQHALIGSLNQNNSLIYGDARTGEIVNLPSGTIIERIIA